MANTHDLFQVYNSLIKLSNNDREKLIQARDSLRSRMQSAYLKLPATDRKTHSIEFQSQGSFVMDTIIKPDKKDFDLDDGVYFEGNLRIEDRSSTQVFHDIIKKSIDKNIEIEDIQDKPPCIRVKYFHKYKERDLGFHIDIPIYYAENYETPELADTINGWVESSPVEFIAWFEERTHSNFQKSFLLETRKFAEPFEKWLTDIRKDDCQLRKIVRYLKAWADLKGDRMPCGIIMSIMAGNHYIFNERDDVCLHNTLIKINNDLEVNHFTCFRPTPKSNEDLFAKSTQNEKQFFKTELEEFIKSANLAIENPNPREACLKWKRHLGDRFPCHLAKDEIEGSKTYVAPSVKNENSRSAY